MYIIKMDLNNVNNLTLHENINGTSETVNGNNIKQSLNRKRAKRESSPRLRAEQHSYTCSEKHYHYEIFSEKCFNKKEEKKAGSGLYQNSSASYIQGESECSSENFSSSPAKSITPRRTHPQSYSHEESISLKELNTLDPSTTVFSGRISFMITSSNNQRIYQELKFKPAHKSPNMASNYLSTQIDSFLKRTDHVMDEWKHLGHRDYLSGLDSNSSKSVANIMIKGFQMMPSIRTTERKRHRSVSYELEDDSTITSGLEEVIVNCFQLYSNLIVFFNNTFACTLQLTQFN